MDLIALLIMIPAGFQLVYLIYLLFFFDSVYSGMQATIASLRNGTTWQKIRLIIYYATVGLSVLAARQNAARSPLLRTVVITIWLLLYAITGLILLVLLELLTP